MNWNCLVVIWRTEENGGETAQLAMDAESHSFPICSNPFGSTRWQHQWQCQHFYLVPNGGSISVMWFVWLEVQVVPVCWNGSFGQHSGTEGTGVTGKRGRAREQGSWGISPTWKKWVHLGQGSAWAQKLLQSFIACAVCQLMSSRWGWKVGRSPAQHL